MKEIMNEWRRFLKKELLANQVLSEAYSSGLVSSLKKKWKAEVPTLTDQQIESYIDVFDKNKNSGPIKDAKGPDITKYSWQEFENLIDANFSIRSANEIQIEGDLKPIYKSPDETLQVFLGDRKEKCIKIRQDFEERSGQVYGWCISRSDASNMFTSYRFRLKEPVFYYVFDTDRNTSDPLHACVIYINSGGDYFLATARNTGDSKHSWDELVQKMPKLRSIKSIFKYVPLTPREREIYEKVGKELSDKDFFNLSRDLKEEYIGFGHDLTDEQIRNVFSLPDGKDLINKYCNMHQELFIPLDIFNKLPNATKRIIQKNFHPDQKEKHDFWYLGKKDISGSFWANSNIKSLPDGMKVGGDLMISSNSKISSLPDNLTVGGDFLFHSEIITSISDVKGLKVGGEFVMTNELITSLPPDIKVLGDIVLSRTAIDSLPKNLKVAKNLWLNGSDIQSLPNGLEVGGSLNLSDTPITSLPPDIKVKHVLTLSFSNIMSLPNGLTLEGTLDLNNTPITSLPERLSIGGDLEIDNTDITSLPEDLIVEGVIYPRRFQEIYNKMKIKREK
jgi:hypothetical protein